MAKINKKTKILNALHTLQKDVFDVDVPENNLINLYNFPTSSVNIFWNRVTRIFDCEFTERPDTLQELADIIEKKLKINWWE